MYPATAEEREPRGHDYCQAQWLWLSGYRRNTFCTGEHWKKRLLVPWWRNRKQARYRLCEHYTTLRTFEAFEQTELRVARGDAIPKLSAKQATYLGVTVHQCNFELFEMLDFYNAALWSRTVEDDYGNVRRKG